MNENNGRCPGGEELHKEYMLFKSRVEEGWVLDRLKMIAALRKFTVHTKGCDQCGVEKEE